MKLGYFVNMYPKVSHAFIRREVLALERLGQSIERYALRGWGDEVVDPDDKAEQSRTHFILKDKASLLVAAAAFVVRHPRRAWAGLQRMMELARRGDRTWAHHVISLVEGIQLARWCRRDGVEHLHAHFGTNSAEVAMLSRAVGGPTYSFTVHGADEWDQPRQYKLREKLRDASFVVAISSFTLSQMARWARPEDRDKIHVVHCGLDGAAFVDAPTPVPDNARIVCVGRLCVEKAQDVLVQAMAVLVQRGIPVQLDLVGDGPLRPRIEALVKQYALEDHVTLSGWASGAEVFRKLRESRLMALPSSSEGLPVVIMESLAMGRPVITTYIAGIPELVRDGREGFLIPAGDVGRLVAALTRALKMPVSELSRMAASGRRRVQARHAIDVEAAKLLQLFRRVPTEGGEVRRSLADAAAFQDSQIVAAMTRAA